MKKVIFLCLASLMAATATAADSNPFENQCQHLAGLDINSPVFKIIVPGGFWKDKEMARAYVRALHDRVDKGAGVLSSNTSTISNRAAVTLAAIVRHDVTLMRRYYGKDVAHYYVEHGWSVMTYAASCNFYDGVKFLLKNNFDPNSGSGIGPFNLALIYGDNVMAFDLLSHGYMINSNYQRCSSSKYIVEHSMNSISYRIRSIVKSVSCSR